MNAETRLRRAMAAVRIVVGIIFLVYGCTKLFDPSFFSSGFMNALGKVNGSAADWYFPFVRAMWHRPGVFAVLVGMVELFLGIALVLGLATRPACVVGMLYMLNKLAITWYPGAHGLVAWEFLNVHMDQIALFCLFLLLAVGRAGDTWGLGAIYHRQHFLKRGSSLRSRPEYSYLYEPERPEEKEAST